MLIQSCCINIIIHLSFSPPCFTHSSLPTLTQVFMPYQFIFFFLTFTYFSLDITPFLFFSFFSHRCLQNYIPPQSLTLSCPVCRQTSILPEKGVAALQNNFFITNLMEVLQRDPECSRPEACNVLESVSAAVAGKPLSCPNHEGKVSFLSFNLKRNLGTPDKGLCVGI